MVLSNLKYLENQIFKLQKNRKEDIRKFELASDQFFEWSIEPESMDQFYTRMMKEIDVNEQHLEHYNFSWAVHDSFHY